MYWISVDDLVALSIVMSYANSGQGGNSDRDEHRP